MTDIATHRAIQGHQDWAKRRQEVLARHPGLVVDATPTPTPTRAAETHNSAAEHDPLQLNGRSIRQHELWRRFVVERKFDETQEDGHGSETASSPTRDLDAALAATAISSSRDTYADLTRRYFGPVYCPEEQTLRSDHSWNYVATGLQRLPADAIRNPYLEGRFSEYPKLLRLVELKRTLVDNCAAPPTYLCADLKDSTAAPPSSPNTSRFHLTTLVPVKYDVVLIDPPLASYEWNSVPSSNRQAHKTWSWDEVSELPIPLLAAKESFVFLWVGPGCSDGLERGREALTRWGYRRCEVITWCLTSDGNTTVTMGQSSAGGAFATTSVHCLMGIRGTVKRSTDSNFVHCNVDTDVLFWPGEKADGTSMTSSPSPVDLRKKPPELYSIIENFCLGTRRVELFGANRNIRRGWLTIGDPDTLGPSAPGWDRVVDQDDHPGSAATDSAVRYKGIPPQEYVKETYDAHFQRDPAGCLLKDRANVVPFDEAVDQLRPRSPNPSHAEFADSQQRADGEGGLNPSPYRTDHLPRGLGYAASGPRNRQRQPPPQHPAQGVGATALGTHNSAAASPLAGNPLSPLPPSALHPTRSPTAGLGAGGPVTVSVPSGSDTLSGPQKSAIGLGLAAAQHRRGGGRGGGPTDDSGGPVGRGGGFGGVPRGPQRGRGGGRGRGAGPSATGRGTSMHPS